VMLVGQARFERQLRQDVATDGVREASRARAPDSPMSGEGKVGCLFDEIGNLVEPTERPHMNVRAELNSHGWRGVARTARLDEESFFASAWDLGRGTDLSLDLT
jgi:hypothetical protein